MDQRKKKFEINKYEGLWYEIAKIPFRYEKGCSFATAEYSWNSKKGVMNIKNSCLDENHNFIYSRSGEATPVVLSESGETKFKVIFNDGFPSDKNDEEWNYRVLYTDYDMYSIVSGNKSTNLWILSRQPKIHVKDALMLLDKVKNFGFNPDSLVSNPSLIYK